MHGMPLLCQASFNPRALILTFHIQDSMQPCTPQHHKILLFIHLNEGAAMHKHTWVHLPMQVKSSVGYYFTLHTLDYPLYLILTLSILNWSRIVIIMICVDRPNHP